MNEYRITFPDRYPLGSPGHADPSARQGYYILASTQEAALARVKDHSGGKLALARPGERVEIQPWKCDQPGPHGGATMTKKYGTPGSVSHATMREEDLIPTFVAVLTDLGCENDNLTAIKALIESPDFKPEDYYGTTEASWDLNESLFDLLNEHAPRHHYFGSHPGDGADYGFWISEELECDCCGRCHMIHRLPDEPLNADFVFICPDCAVPQDGDVWVKDACATCLKPLRVADAVLHEPDKFPTHEQCAAEALYPED